MAKKAKKVDKVWVNLNGIDRKDLDIVLNNSSESTAYVDLNKLKNNPSLYVQILSNAFDISKGAKNFKEFMTRYSEIERDSDTDKKLNEVVVRVVKEMKPRYSYQKIGKGLPEILKLVDKFLDDKSKDSIINTIIEKKKSLYPYIKKDLAKLSLEFASTDQQISNVISNFYKSFDGKTFNNAVDKLEDGIENPIIKKIVDKSNKFKILTYNKAEIKHDNDKKIKLLKDIAKTPSSVKNLAFSINFSYDDILKLAPVMRFNFLQWYFEPMFKAAARAHANPNQYNHFLGRAIKGHERIKISPDLTDAQIDTLLFAVGFKKNTQATEFKEAYNALLKIKSGKSISRSDAKQVFGSGLIKYYYYW